MTRFYSNMTISLRIASLAVLLAIALVAPPAEPSSVLHVALLGDSLAHGAGDESGKGIAGRLGPELSSRGVESIVTKNLGATGATTRDLEAALGVPATRAVIERAGAIVVSIGANDLRRTLLGEPLRSPLAIAGEVLGRIDGIVTEIRAINANARILILGAYAPIAHEHATAALEPLVAIWDSVLLSRFADDPLVFVVRMSDIVDRPSRLSKLDSFHPGGEAYQEMAKRIAELLIEERE